MFVRIFTFNSSLAYKNYKIYLSDINIHILTLYLPQVFIYIINNYNINNAKTNSHNWSNEYRDKFII